MTHILVFTHYLRIIFKRVSTAEIKLVNNRVLVIPVPSNNNTFADNNSPRLELSSTHNVAKNKCDLISSVAKDNANC